VVTLVMVILVLVLVLVLVVVMVLSVGVRMVVMPVVGQPFTGLLLGLERGQTIALE
jgi:hypothetical protein